MSLDDDDGIALEARREMSRFWDAIDLARSGTCGDLQTERKLPRSFLERWSKGDGPPREP
jgi:hypothetical protein